MEIKYKDFIDVVPTILCQKSSSIIGYRIYGDRRIQGPLSCSARVDPLAQKPG